MNNIYVWSSGVYNNCHVMSVSCQQVELFKGLLYSALLHLYKLLKCGKTLYYRKYKFQHFLFHI